MEKNGFHLFILKFPKNKALLCSVMGLGDGERIAVPHYLASPKIALVQSVKRLNYLFTSIFVLSQYQTVANTLERV
jgi:hypothetical protein